MMKKMPIMQMLAIAFFMFYLPACDRPKKLLEENARLEVKLQNGWAEMRAIDAKLLGLGMDVESAIIILERRCKDIEGRCEELDNAINKETQSIIYASEVVSRLENVLKTWKPQVDSYKAKFNH